eukprot:TRINITY_DN3209_c4_g1_i1.p1 TRINITY_DN3209_c4_g1~~TRINITY_DN3209_c4_g1_i1.p1  ORF type:complete len:521 (+),score=35.29 TRINITY_DN3209_c4_g1_i1:66-1565(+)
MSRVWTSILLVFALSCIIVLQTASEEHVPTSKQPAEWDQNALFNPAREPSVTYNTKGRTEFKTEKVTYYHYPSQTCQYIFEHTIGEVLGPKSANITAVLETCSAHPRCQSVYCETFKCTLLNPSCVLTPGHAAGNTYIAPNRTPLKLNLKERAAHDVKLFASKSSIKAATWRVKEVTGRAYNRSEIWSSEVVSNMTSLKDHENINPPLWVDVTERDLKSFSSHVLVDPIHKLILFTVPKAACSEFLRLYDRLVGHEDYDDSLYGVAVHFRFTDTVRKRLLLSEFTPEEATLLMNNPDYEKIVFFRDPKIRLLSAYLDKFVMTNSYHQRVFMQQKKMTFSDLIEKLKVNDRPPNGVGPFTNAHWRSQILVANVFKFLPLMDFIGWATGEHVKLLLEKYSLWETYGAKGWRSPEGFMQRKLTTDGHATDSRSKMSSYYSSPRMHADVEKAYELDIKTFQSLGFQIHGPPVSGHGLLPRVSVCPQHQVFATACYPGKLLLPS